MELSNFIIQKQQLLEKFSEVAMHQILSFHSTLTTIIDFHNMIFFLPNVGMLNASGIVDLCCRCRYKGFCSS
jgi:hypothetical protein